MDRKSKKEDQTRAIPPNGFKNQIPSMRICGEESVLSLRLSSARSLENGNFAKDDSNSKRASSILLFRISLRIGITVETQLKLELENKTMTDKRLKKIREGAGRSLYKRDNSQ